MEITINNQLKIIAENISLQDLIFTQVGEKQKGIAVAINNTVISKQNWQSTYIKQNDTILIIKASQGG